MKRIIVLALALICIIGTVGCVNKNDSINASAKNAYSAFLSGDRTLLAEGQAEKWYIPSFQDDVLKYEYTYLDLDGDGVVELLVQLENDPCGYNAVFDFSGEEILCRNSDSIEMSCRDYPLNDGIMVRQYDYSGTRSYTLFRYKSNGEAKNISQLFARDELVNLNSTDPCPYYEIDGEEVEREEFDKKINSLITKKLIKREDWKKV